MAIKLLLFFANACIGSVAQETFAGDVELEGGMTNSDVQLLQTDLNIQPSKPDAVTTAMMEGSEQMKEWIQATEEDNTAGESTMRSDVEPENRLQNMRPLQWIHVPKCGSSFLHVMYNHPRICPNAPGNLVVPKANKTNPRPMRSFLKAYPPEEFCPDSFAESRACLRSHCGAAYTWNKHVGHHVGLFRQPEQRIISAWNHKERNRAGFLGPHMWTETVPPKDMHDYAVKCQGCATKMLSRMDPREVFTPNTMVPWNQPCACPATAPPSSEEVELAVSRVRMMPFVGITEEWHLSVCLFHAKFGGECKENDFINSRPSESNLESQGITKEDGSYDTLELDDFVDEADGKVYAEATRVFQEDLVRFGVTPESCSQRCSPT